MAGESLPWLSNGQGRQPVKRWSFSTDAPLASLVFAIESRDTLLADTAGGLYRLTYDGKLFALSRGFHGLNRLASDDLGRCGAAICEETKLTRFNRKLQTDWTVELPAEATAMAMDPHGEHLAVALENGKCVVYDASHQRVFHVESPEPIGFLHFSPRNGALIGAGEFGRVTQWSATGESQWSKNLRFNIGDLTANGDDERIALAAFAEGVKLLNPEGKRSGSWLLEGTPHHVSSSFAGNRLAAATLEGHLYWLDGDGELVSGAELPEEVIGLAASALGDSLVIGFESGRVICLGWDEN